MPVNKTSNEPKLKFLGYFLFLPLIVIVSCGEDGNKESTRKVANNYLDSLGIHNGSNKKSKKAKTYAYWQTARKLINVCADTQQLRNHQIEDIDHQYLVLAVAQSLKKIPDNGVDPLAAKSIQTLADNVVNISKMNKDIEQNETKLGVKVGVVILSVLAGGFGEDDVDVSDDTQSDDDIDDDNNISQDDPGNSFSQAKSFGSGVIGIYKEQKAISEIMDSTNELLSRSRQLLKIKYHRNFAAIKIIK